MEITNVGEEHIPNIISIATKFLREVFIPLALRIYLLGVLICPSLNKSVEVFSLDKSVNIDSVPSCSSGRFKLLTLKRLGEHLLGTAVEVVHLTGALAASMTASSPTQDES